MDTNEHLNFVKEVEKDEINSIIEPIADDDVDIDNIDIVHVIGGEALRDDALNGLTPDAYVMDVDSNDTFDFIIAEENYDGIVDIDNAVDAFEEIDADHSEIEPFVMDIDSDETFDFDIASENADGVIDGDGIYDNVSDMYSLGNLPENIRDNIIGLDSITEDSAATVEDPLGDDTVIESHEDLYSDSSDLDIMTDDIDDIV